ncbi:MAG: flavodoxin [Spirochaetaceae bacterium]|jgi:flavodoxin short chain|nr:flavodoxin [Spirochaetaceae bacterium]
MKKVLIVYWSASGNTELMAKEIASGVKKAGGEAELKTPGAVSPQAVKDAPALAFGCPAMGDEVLEEEEMEPFIASLSKDELAGKPLGLFGSYDWGDGLWMRSWVERMSSLGAKVDGSGLIAHLEPDAAVLAECAKLGARLAE